MSVEKVLFLLENIFQCLLELQIILSLQYDLMVLVDQETTRQNTDIVEIDQANRLAGRIGYDVPGDRVFYQLRA